MSGLVAWRGVAAAIAAISAYALTVSLSYTLLSLVLDREGYSEALIGLNAAMTPLGIIVSAPVMPALAGRYGGYRVMMASLASGITVLILLAAFPNIILWFFLRFVFGAVVNGVFVVSETWINQLAPTRMRGRIIAIYAVSASVGYAAGPTILAVIGSQGWLPFAVAVVGAVLAMAVIIPARRELPPVHSGSMRSFWRFLPLAPTLLLGTGVVGLFDQTVLALLPIYGIELGMIEAKAALAAGVLIAGNILLQFPIGWIADRCPRRSVRLVLAILAALCALFLPYAMHQSVFLWPLLILWGAVAFGVYTVSLAELGDRFEGETLLAGNAAFALVWGVGGLMGPAVSGTAMSAFGPIGFPTTLAFWFVLLTFMIVWRRKAVA